MIDPKSIDCLNNVLSVSDEFTGPITEPCGTLRASLIEFDIPDATQKDYTFREVRFAPVDRFAHNTEPLA